MKKRILPLLLTICLLFSACASGESIQPTQESDPPATMPQETEPPVTEPPITEPPVTEPLHSDLYIPDVSVEDVIRYFNEVCLDAEYADGGDPSYVQKWDAPISYIIDGKATDADIAVLESFVHWLNQIDGFPGMYEATNSKPASLFIYFCTRQELLDRMGSNFTNVDGAVTFWYDDNVIFESVICYRTDLDQHLRNSVILEEIYNGLGPIQDTTLREDSIIYSGFSQPQSLTPIDELILKLLYHPDIRPGMDAQQCETTIRQLYY